MPRLISPRCFLVLTVATAAFGCGGGGSATPTEDATLDSGIAPDGGASPDGINTDVSRSHCPMEPTVQGAAMARVRWENGIAFCIDSTEVTNAQYAAFLAAQVTATAVTTQSARCGWNKTFTPETTATNGPPCPGFDPGGRADLPVVCVDWCDADAYCRWAGKRLCQKPGGGAVAAVTIKDESEWVIACTGDGAGKYPYGDAAAAGKCVDRQFPAPMPALRAVKEATMCEGGVPGLFDMSGNASEWQNDCVEVSGPGGVVDGGDGSMDSCPASGGSFSADLASASCTSVAPFMRKQVAGDAGFRCCVDAEF